MLYENKFRRVWIYWKTLKDQLNTNVNNYSLFTPVCDVPVYLWTLFTYWNTYTVNGEQWATCVSVHCEYTGRKSDRNINLYAKDKSQVSSLEAHTTQTKLWCWKVFMMTTFTFTNRDLKMRRKQRQQWWIYER